MTEKFYRDGEAELNEFKRDNGFADIPLVGCDPDGVKYLYVHVVPHTVITVLVQTLIAEGVVCEQRTKYKKKHAADYTPTRIKSDGTKELRTDEIAFTACVNACRRFNTKIAFLENEKNAEFLAPIEYPRVVVSYKPAAP